MKNFKTKSFLPSFLLLIILFFNFIPIFSQQDTVKLDSILIKNKLKKLIESHFGPKPKPIFSVHFKGGLNISKMNIIDFYVPNTDYYPPDTKFGAGVISGFGINFPITKKWEISTEINYSKKRLSTSENLSGFSKVDLIEKQKWIEFPLYCRYSFGGLKLAPYVLSGVTISRLLGSKGYLSRGYIEVDGNYRIISSMYSLINHRKKYNFSLTVGIGAEYYINQDRLFFDFRYDHGLVNIVNTNKSISEAFFLKYYLDNDFRITNMIFTFGYKKSIFRRKPIIN